MIRVAVLGAGLWGPGLPGWSDSVPVLRGERPYAEVALPPPPPAMLSPTERRRTGLAVRLALTVAAEASHAAGIAPGGCRSIFATANGDGAVINALLGTLAEAEPQVSPTLFHNSVHNAAAGYWSIGTGSQLSASCLGCHDAAFGAALLAAGAEAVVEQAPVLLCVYDAPLPFPLDATHPTRDTFGFALVLAPAADGGRGPHLTLRYAGEPAGSGERMPRLPALRPLAAGNAAARSLRMLEAIARGEADRMHAEMLDGRLEIDVAPCSTAPASAG